MSFKPSASLAIDFYKSGHKFQYPKGTTMVYSNFTGRSSRLAKMLGAYYDETYVFYGLQGFIKFYLIDLWNDTFFKSPKDEAVAKYQRIMDNCLGPDAVPVDHIAELWELGYLPLLIKALPEGSKVNIRIPCITIRNTHAEFYWLTNYIETVISAEVWKMCTSATIARQYRELLNDYAEKTGTAKEFVQWQAHDFSFRGMSGLYDAASTGSGHLLSFTGTDTIPAIEYLEYFYGTNVERELVGGSVPATEHSVMCMGGKETEYETFKRLITEVYPSGIVSIVSDTWDFWKIMTETSVQLKSEILGRDGKVVFRPDSGDPVKILTGYTDGEIAEGNLVITEQERKGAVELLWEVFGGTVTDKDYKMLDSHVGLIYGDSITLERAEEILKRLERKGFASGNVVFGVGSYTYQYVTRDTFGFAVKSTYGEVNFESVELEKDPVTDSGVKKSAKGLLRVEREGDKFVLYEQQTWDQESEGALRPVYFDGDFTSVEDLATIRARLASQ